MSRRPPTPARPSTSSPPRPRPRPSSSPADRRPRSDPAHSGCAPADRRRAVFRLDSGAHAVSGAIAEHGAGRCRETDACLCPECYARKFGAEHLAELEREQLANVADVAAAGIVVIGCGAAKLPHRAPAQLLY